MARRVAGWAALLLLLALQCTAGFLPLGRLALPVALLLVAMMVAVTAILFMDLRRSPGVARIFAIGGLFWLAILFGLTSADYLTRILGQG